MRISDWSSDVCSSDLSTQADCRTCIVRFLVPLARSEHQFHGSRSERGRIQRWRFPLYLWGDEDGGSPALKGGWSYQSIPYCLFTLSDLFLLRLPPIFFPSSPVLFSTLFFFFLRS